MTSLDRRISMLTSIENRKNKNLTLCLILKYTVAILLISLTSFSEVPYSGIYIVAKPVKKNPCEQELEMLVGKRKICTSKKPIISIEELEYVTDILYDPTLKLNYINLGLSSKSVTVLNQTVDFLPHSQFALVVENDVICIFTIHESFTDRFLRIGSDLDLKNLTIVHDALKKVRY